MIAQPTFATAKQFVHLRIPDVIVLLVVENRQQHVEMRQDVVDRRMSAERKAEIRARAPIREFLVEWNRHSANVVAKRIEQCMQNVGSAACADYLDSYFQRQF